MFATEAPEILAENPSSTRHTGNETVLLVRVHFRTDDRQEHISKTLRQYKHFRTSLYHILQPTGTQNIIYLATLSTMNNEEVDVV